LRSPGIRRPWLRSRQTPAFVDVGISPPVGVGRGVRWESVTVRLPPGAVMALYTDGLVERRRQSLDVGLSYSRP
jgi:hypothetical protein